MAKQTKKWLIEKQAKVNFNKDWSTKIVKEVGERFDHNIQASYKANPIREINHFDFLTKAIKRLNQEKGPNVCKWTCYNKVTTLYP